MRHGPAIGRVFAILVVAAAGSASCRDMGRLQAPDGADGADAGGDGGLDPAGAADGADDPDRGGTPVAPPSCTGLPSTCGASGAQSCCDSLPVPGGTYDRSNDPTYPATVSEFRLDKFEITVGRFRKFVEAGMGTRSAAPAAGAGANPFAPGTGWDAAWNAGLPADSAALRDAVKCGLGSQTWTDAPAANEDRPMICISWYEAFAFCVWDGGRLPTETEWNYAAAGGSEQRIYPWGSAAADDSYAVYCGGSCSFTQDVGSKSPKGDGRWGQVDLAGNVWEWTFDWYQIYADVCRDCAASAATGATSRRVIRGGSNGSTAFELLSARRDDLAPANLGDDLGARCARSAR